MITTCSIIVGVCHIILALSLFTTNALLFTALLLNKDYKAGTSRIIMSICVACMMQLFVLTIGGVMTVFQTVFSYHFDKALGVLIESGWCLYVALNFILAVDRLLIFIRLEHTIITNVLLSLSWLLWLSLAITLSMPGFGVTFVGRSTFYFWKFSEEWGSQLLSQYDPFYDLGMFCLTFVMYLIVFVHLVKLRKSSSTQSGSHKAEIRIFVVAIMAFVDQVFYEILVYSVKVSREVYMDVLQNTVWLAECGMFATVTLIINTTLRRKAITRNIEFRTHTYKIIKNICLSCMMQQIVLAAGGVMTICHTTFHYYVDKILGLLIQSSWWLYVALTLALAVDRLLIFLHPMTADNSLFTNIVLPACWLLWLSMVVILAMPGFGVTYSGAKGERYYYWDYDNSAGSTIMSVIDTYYNIVVFVATFLIYLVVFVHLLKIRKASTNQSSSYKAEMRLFIVAIITFANEVMYELFAYFAEITAVVYVDIMLNMVWLIECGVFATLTLVINKRLRRKVIDMLSSNNKVMVISIVETRLS
ncbi:hypothetical protein QR680_003702 [Steinernema hermaphroditum]|uniref:Uncharacterized protein n=1 Tax=Steinernema hermaphroditum TaxID=289476 RepID=A0AA39HL94_9BILA|nr:hypothetical protein QR680_003702 [Steinernema hermaphroditum]